MDFIGNNSAPFHHDQTWKKMGSWNLNPNFTLPIDILAHLIKNCVLKGRYKEKYDEIKFFL